MMDEAMIGQQAGQVEQMAAALDAELIGPGADESAVKAVDPASQLGQELAMIMGIAVEVLAPAFPCLPGIYTEQVKQGAGAAIAGVCAKHGWMAGGMLNGWGEEVAAAAVVLPLAVATYTGCKADAEKRAQMELKRKVDAAAHLDMTRGVGGIAQGVPDHGREAGARSLVIGGVVTEAG